VITGSTQLRELEAGWSWGADQWCYPVWILSSWKICEAVTWLLTFKLSCTPCTDMSDTRT